MTSAISLTAHYELEDGRLREYLEDAHLPSLLGTLAYATCDMAVLREEFRPNYVVTPLGFERQGGMSADAQADARAMAFTIIRGLQNGEYADVSAPSPAEVRQIMEFMVGPFSDEYSSLLLHELDLPNDLDAPGWHKSEVAPDSEFTVAIIGAGKAGIGAAYRLKQVGVPFVLLERHKDAGGVWLENSYPGCRLDTSNFGYSYSFNQNPSWEEEFSSRPAVLEYLQESAEKFGLLGHTRFNTEVIAGQFDENDATWQLTLKNADGATEKLRVQAVISAVGQLNQPNYPKVDNIEAFRGPAWHTSRWNHDEDLAGKRVAVIGTGASAFQAIQKIAPIAGELTIFQRTAPWFSATPGYNSLLKTGSRWLMENVPNYHRWSRVYRLWTGMSRRSVTVVDPSWVHPISVSEKNEGLRQVLLGQLRDAFSDRPDLLEKMTPLYPPLAKRMMNDDGTWTATLKRPNVKLVTDKITRAVETGIETDDGIRHEFDILIYGTGFKAAYFLSTLSLTGRGGVDLHEQWHGDDARAYYGMTIPNFPNLFCLYGPNTNLNANSSGGLLSDSMSLYITECIRTLLESGHRTMEVRQDVLEEYNARIDAASKTVVYGASAVNSWYKNSIGRLTQNWPLRSVDYWTQTRKVNPNDYLFD